MPERDSSTQGWGEMLPGLLLIVCAAAIAVMPLWTGGLSCGHDFNFHLRSWMEAAAQWRAGTVRPVWAFNAAWNAGEPRLLFYPPLSWALGGFLTLLLPWLAVPSVFTFLVLLLGGFSMYRMVRRWSAAPVAAMAGCLYVANPYMLFVAYERSAYAELLAAAWMPMLFGAVLTRRVSVPKIAVLVALLWLTNAPAAVVGSYSVLIVGVARLLLMQREGAREQGQYAVRVTAGFALGLLLDSWYLVPLAVERKYVQLNAALAPLALPTANFLFAKSADEFHEHVLVQASWIGVVTILIALVCGGALLISRWHTRRYEAGAAARRFAAPLGYGSGRSTAALVVYSIVVLFLLSKLSAPVWRVAPQMVFLQFPWRFLAAEGAVAIALLSLAVGQIRWTRRWPAAAAFGLGVTLLAAWTGGDRSFRQGCSDDETAPALRSAFASHEGYEPTDEYTPEHTDNDVLQMKLPEAWIAGGVDEDPVARNVLRVEHRRMDDWVVHTSAGNDDSFLVLRVRAFPGWHVQLDGVDAPASSQRGDGLTDVPLHAGGPHTVELMHRTMPEQWEGLAASLAGVGLAVMLWRRERRASVSSSIHADGEFF